MTWYGVPATSWPDNTFSPVAVLICRAVRPSTASVASGPQVVCGTKQTIALSITAADANTRLDATVYAVDVPPVAMPPRSSRHSATRAILARALSFTLDGACPSAQLIELSAVAFVAAVRLQRCSPVATALSFHKKEPRSGNNKIWAASSGPHYLPMERFGAATTLATLTHSIVGLSSAGPPPISMTSSSSSSTEKSHRCHFLR